MFSSVCSYIIVIGLSFLCFSGNEEGIRHDVYSLEVRQAGRRRVREPKLQTPLLSARLSLYRSPEHHALVGARRHDRLAVRQVERAAVVGGAASEVSK